MELNENAFDIELTEDTLGQAAKDLEAQTLTAESKNQIERTLDRSLARAKRKQAAEATGDFPNILLISDAGFGKTDMVRQWAAKNNINLVQKNLGTMGADDFGGILTKDADDPKHATRIGSNELIRALQKPNSVLFLDEYNRSKTETRGAVLTLVQNHRLPDPTAEGGEVFLPNLLFTIAAINPPNSSYKGAKELDPAERSRFNTLELVPDPLEHLDYLRKVYTKAINDAEDAADKLENEGRLKIAETLLTAPEFTYDSGLDIEANEDNPSYKPLNYRSLKLALDWCDGTKKDFLDTWNHYCNPSKKKIVEVILKNYRDVEDEANAVLKDGTKSNVFKKSLSNMDKIRAYLAAHGE